MPRAIHPAERHIGQPFAPIGGAVFFETMGVGKKRHCAQLRIIAPQPAIAKGTQALAMHYVEFPGADGSGGLMAECHRIARVIDLAAEDGIGAQVGRRIVVAQGTYLHVGRELG